MGDDGDKSYLESLGETVAEEIVEDVGYKALKELAKKIIF